MNGWISIKDKKPDQLNVRVRFIDGSEVNCWHQSDGDFYWNGGGREVFLDEYSVTHWKPNDTSELLLEGSLEKLCVAIFDQRGRPVNEQLLQLARQIVKEHDLPLEVTNENS